MSDAVLDVNPKNNILSCLIKISKPRICYDFRFKYDEILKSVGTFCAYLNETFLETTFNLHYENRIIDTRFEFHDKPLGDIDLVMKSISNPESVPKKLFDEIHWYLKEVSQPYVRERFIEIMNDIAKDLNPYTVQINENYP